MKTPEDEAFDELARKQGAWGGGFTAKRKMAADKLQEPAQEPVAWMVYTQDGKSVYVTDNPTDIQEGQRALPLYTTPPQPAQEPVAWANPNDLKNFDMKVRTNGGPLHTTPLYTTPPKRPWVGLTYEDIEIAFDNTRECNDPREFAYAVEAKLKERNS